MVSSTIFAQATATEILKIYLPPLFARKIDCKFMSCAGRTLADTCDVLLDFSRQVIDVMGVVRVIVDYGAPFGDRREFT